MGEILRMTGKSKALNRVSDRGHLTRQNVEGKQRSICSFDKHTFYCANKT